MWWFVDFILLILLNIFNLQKKVESIIGTYECKIDNKGRIILPNALKKQLASTLADGFVLKRSVFQTCLELYPMAEFNKMMQKINKLNKFSADNNNFIRRFSAGVKMIDIDGLGRLLIPKDLLVFGQFSKEIVLSSAVNIIEIWDKDLYEKAIDDSVSDFAKLAQEVMSNLNE
ncbi:division/cell wall cluster transcriptional repressor MraZ [Flavobacterium branchiophilum]